MKNKALLEAISSLLKIDKGVLDTASENETGDGNLISKFLEGNNVYSLTDIATLNKNNIQKGVVQGLAELEKAEEFPPAIYSRVKGVVLGKKESEVAKKNGITDYNGFDDLISKISAQGKGGDEEKDKQIIALKQTIITNEEASTKSLSDIESKYTNDFTTRDFKNAVDGLKLEGEDEAVTKQKQLYSDALLNSHKLDYKDGKTVVLGKDGSVITNNLGDPETLTNIYTNFALSYGAKIKTIDTGGRGDGSSKGQPNKLSGKTLSEAMEAAKVEPNSAEADKVHAEWTAANK